MKTDIFNKANRTFGKVGLKFKKHSPEILVGAGVVGVVASTVMACKATTKINDVLADSKMELEAIHEAGEKLENGVSLKLRDGGEYTLDDYKKDLTINKVQAGMKLVKLYAPSVALGAASLTCILAGHTILKKRNIALAAAYATIDRSFKDYRGRVVERFGKELDKELRYNIRAQEFDEVVIDDKGKEKTVKSTVNVASPNETSDYARFFDDGCTGWTKDPESNLMFLKSQQAYANQKLQTKGYLFLNEVYDMLGIPRTAAGQCVGWVFDEKQPNGDNYVDFGIYDANKPVNRDFVNGWERTILLDFNVDGNILDLI